MLITLLRKVTNGRDLIRQAMRRFANAYLTLGCLDMFDSDYSKSNRFATTKDGRKIAKSVMDHRFWKNNVMCLKTANSLMEVLRLVDFDAKPTMSFINEVMDSCQK
ncbi:unnamed protein product [Lathyrus sativus]|nr:unnamed protein product [Lathyrus sativus]